MAQLGSRCSWSPCLTGVVGVDCELQECLDKKSPFVLTYKHEILPFLKYPKRIPLAEIPYVLKKDQWMWIIRHELQDSRSNQHRCHISP